MTSTVAIQAGRRDRRFLVRMPVSLSLGKRSFVSFTSDVSLRGLFVCSSQEVQVRQFVRLDITLPFNGHKVSLFGAVAHVVPTSTPGGRQAGFGVELYGNGGVELSQWDAFITEIRNHYPQAVAIEVDLTTGTTSAHHRPRQARHFETELFVRTRFQGIDDLVLMFSRDVGRGGMFIATDIVAPMGTLLRLTLVHPQGGAGFELECVVRRSVSDGEQRGLGVEFVNLDGHRRNQLWDFISSGDASSEQSTIGLSADYSSANAA